METIQMQNLNVNDLKTIINDCVKDNLKTLTAPEPETELITRQQTCKILGISLPTLHTFSKEGKIPAYHIGTRVRYKKNEVLQSLKEFKTLKY